MQAPRVAPRQAPPVQYAGGRTTRAPHPPMIVYLLRRVFLAMMTCVVISILAFVIIQLPPGDFVDAYITDLAASGSAASQALANAMRHEYGLDRPLVVQYWLWIWHVAHGDFGASMVYRRPVAEVIGDRLWLTMVVSLSRALPDLDDRAADRHLLRDTAIFCWATTCSPCSASSAWRCRTSCWR